MSTAVEVVILVLVVDGHPEDARPLMDAIAAATDIDAWDVRLAASLADAGLRLQAGAVDLALLDIGVPHAKGAAAISELRAATPDIPIVVVNGPGSDSLARAYVQSGAQRYIARADVGSASLRRAIADVARRGGRGSDAAASSLLAEESTLAASGLAISFKARLAGAATLKAARPDLFAGLVDSYATLFDQYIALHASRRPKPWKMMQRIADCLGNCDGGPRDLVDLHVAALQRVTRVAAVGQADGLVVNGRLLALEMMGLLVSYYRDGRHQRMAGGEPS